MNFKKTAVALAMGMMVSGGAMAQVTIDLGGATDVTFDADRLNATITTITDNTDPAAPVVTYGLEFGARYTSFSDIANALGTSANVTALAASLNEVNLDGSIVIDGATISFSAIENVNATANATSSNVESATATARAINGNSLATTVIGAMGTTDLENRISDAVATDFAAQTDSVGVSTIADLTGGLGTVVEVDGTTTTTTNAGNVVSGLGDLAMVSASVNTGELLGNIAITATNSTPTWFLNDQVVASVNLTNLDAATTVIGAMNTTNAINEVMRDVSLKTAVQVTGTPAN